MQPPTIRAFLVALAIATGTPGTLLAADIVDTAKADGHFTMLLKAGEQAGAATWLKSPGPITVFAPDDAAFAKVPKATLRALMRRRNAGRLKLVVGNHAVAGLVTMADLDEGLTGAPAVAVPAMSGMPLVITWEGARLTVNGAHIVKGPIKVDNGLVYVVDRVLLPPMPIQPRL